MTDEELIKLLQSIPDKDLLRALSVELGRLRAENTALREIVREVARASIYHDSQGGMLIVSDPDVLVVKACALLGKE